MGGGYFVLALETFIYSFIIWLFSGFWYKPKPRLAYLYALLLSSVFSLLTPNIYNQYQQLGSNNAIKGQNNVYSKSIHFDLDKFSTIYNFPNGVYVKDLSFIDGVIAFKSTTFAVSRTAEDNQIGLLTYDNSGKGNIKKVTETTTSIEAPRTNSHALHLSTSTLSWADSIKGYIYDINSGQTLNTSFVGKNLWQDTAHLLSNGFVNGDHDRYNIYNYSANENIPLTEIDPATSTLTPGTVCIAGDTLYYRMFEYNQDNLSATNPVTNIVRYELASNKRSVSPATNDAALFVACNDNKLLYSSGVNTIFIQDIKSGNAAVSISVDQDMRIDSGKLIGNKYYILDQKDPSTLSTLDINTRDIVSTKLKKRVNTWDTTGSAIVYTSYGQNIIYYEPISK